MGSAIDRASAAADRIRSATKAAFASNPGASAMASIPGIPYARPDMALAQNQLDHFKGHAFTAINVIAKRIAGQQVMVANKSAKGMRNAKSPACSLVRKSYLDDLLPLKNHALLDLLAQPNPVMFKWHLLFHTVASLEITGKAYWWLTGAGDNQSIWPIPTSWVEPQDILGRSFLIRPFGVPITPFEISGDDIAYFHLPDPADPFSAMSPMQAQAAGVDADEAMQEAQAKAFRNGIFPGYAVKLGPGPEGYADTSTSEREATPLLEGWQRQQLETVFRRFYQGVDKAASVIVLDALIKDIIPVTNKPAEMDFLNSGKATKSRIFETYGVNPICVGSTEGANRAQSVVADESLCVNVLNPLIEMMSQVLTFKVGPRFGKGLEVWIDPARAHDTELLIQEWELMIRWGLVTRNEARAHIAGLGPMPGGDVVVMPLNTEAVPVGQLPISNEPDDTELDEEASGADKALKKKRGTSKGSRPPG